MINVSHFKNKIYFPFQKKLFLYFQNNDLIIILILVKHFIVISEEYKIGNAKKVIFLFEFIKIYSIQTKIGYILLSLKFMHIYYFYF